MAELYQQIKEINQDLFDDAEDIVIKAKLVKKHVSPGDMDLIMVGYNVISIADDSLELFEEKHEEKCIEFSDKEKEILQFMYENTQAIACLIHDRLDGDGIESNDIYYLFEKLGLIDIVIPY